MDKQRLVYASMYAFEDSGVEELERELLRKFELSDLHCEYSSNEDVLVIKGELEGLIAPITVFVSSFIEKQNETGDLFADPRIRLLDLPAALRDNDSVMDTPYANSTGGLLSFDDDPATVVPHSFTRYTKNWLGTEGGAVCFPHELLHELAKHTGTQIVSINGFESLQVSGRRDDDVNDALERLSAIEKPLSYLRNPRIENLAFDIATSGLGMVIEKFDKIYSDVPRHILTGSFMGSSAIFVTSFYSLNKDTGKYGPLNSLTQTSVCRNQNSRSRIWDNFVFQEIGKEDEFAALGSLTETNDAEIQLVPLSSNLSPEKEKQVRQWTERVELNVEAPKLVPGIKQRRPIQAQADANQGPAAETPGTASSMPPLSSPETRNSPRKRVMNYANPSSSANTHTAKSLSNYKLSSGQSAMGFSGPKDIPNRASLSVTQNSSSNLKSQRANENVTSIQNRPPSESRNRSAVKEGKLIDMLTSVNPMETKHLQSQISMTSLQPLPSIAGETTTPLNSSDSQLTTSAEDKIADSRGLHTAEPASPGGSATTKAVASEAPKEKQETRLENLYLTYNSLGEAPSTLPARPCQQPGDYSRLLESRVLGDLERATKSESVQAKDEATTRKFHRTMGQKASKPSPKAINKAASAKKQATLDDAWGKPKQKKLIENLQKPENKVNTEKIRKQSINEDTERSLTALKPILEAAEALPGTVIFEIQFGLVLIPLMPRTRNADLMSPTEWSEIFRPKNGVSAPSTKFVNKLTACGSEIDHIVDLGTSKAEGKSQMFEQPYDEYNVRYEFHCRPSADELLIIVIDEQGGFSVEKPKEILGAVNLHCPKSVWDARAVIKAATQYQPISHADVEECAKHIAEHLWIPGDKNICIHTSLPKGCKIVIEKVVMRRWTMHRYLPFDEANNQDIFLQVTEVQDLIIGFSTKPSLDNRYVRARYTDAEEMIQRQKTWYELSLVSRPIETILATNVALEVGQRTEEWCTSDLLGDTCLSNNQTLPKSLAAAAVGAADIAQMVELAKEVVKKMDAVGACNHGPVVQGAVQPDKGLEYEQIQSVKEVESIKERMDVEAFDIIAHKKGEVDKEYW
ncbi:hypothetical protein BDW74DRAFT_158205 [Aspergillus multicolor]|uniref:uncharacterized protein n=1 Tax=Aspergillus multicolor TaxID=41759 RepID=UPI003CCD9561